MNHRAKRNKGKANRNKNKIADMITREPQKKPKEQPKRQSEIVKISKAKDMLEYGIIQRAIIVPNPMKDGWLIELMIKSGELKTLETDRGEARVFKSIDTAYKAVEMIGLESATVSRKRSNLHN